LSASAGLSSGRARVTGAGILLGLLIVASYSDPLFFRRVFTGRDPIGYHYPVENAVHDAYARGRLPVWMPGISGGRPLLANPNVGALYPVRPLLSAVPFPAAIRLFPLLHWIGAGIGMLLLLRGLGVPPKGSWLGAVTYVFSGVSVSFVFYPNMQPGFALLPWLVWTLTRPSKNAAGRILPPAIVLSLLLLAGDVFGIALALLASALWIALEVPARDRAPAASRLAASLGIAALVAAPQIIGAALWVPETNRAVLGMKLAEAFLFSISPYRLLELVVPYPFGTTWEVDVGRVWGYPIFRQKALGFFTTLYCGALAVIALPAAWKTRAAGARLMKFFLLATLALCVLPRLLPAGFGDLPSPLPLRYPEKFATGFVFALSALTGMAAESLRARRGPPRWTLAVGAALALSALAVRLWPRGSGDLAAGLIGAEPRHAAVAGALLPAALAEAGLLWMLTVIGLAFFVRNNRVGAGVSLVLLTMVPILANRKIAQTAREENVLAPTAFARWVARSDPEGVYRVLGESTFRLPSALEASQMSSDLGQVEVARRGWRHYTHTLWGASTVFNSDFDAGDFSRIESLRRIAVMAAGFRDAGHFFGGLSLRFGIRFRDQEPFPGYGRVRGDALQDWDQHEAAYPDLRLLQGWREESSGLAALQALPGLAPGEVVLETERRFSGRARPGDLRVLERSPERLRFETRTEDPAWIFFVRSFWNHRVVRMDGREVPYVPAQLAFTAVPVPVGIHRFEWREEVPGWKVSRWGPPIAAAIALLLLFFRRPQVAS
jgi:hypothetical protein